MLIIFNICCILKVIGNCRSIGRTNFLLLLLNVRELSDRSCDIYIYIHHIRRHWDVSSLSYLGSCFILGYFI